MPLTNEQIIAQLGELHSMNVEVMRRLDTLEEKPSPALDLSIEADQNSRLEALEATAPPRGKVAAFDALAERTAALEQSLDMITINVTALEACGPGRADWIVRASERIERLESADGLSDTAFSLLGDRVKALEAKAHSPARDMIAGPEFDRFRIATLDDLAKLRGSIRDLIRVLSEWAPDGRDNEDAAPRPDSLPGRLKHLVALTPNDLSRGAGE